MNKNKSSQEQSRNKNVNSGSTKLAEPKQIPSAPPEIVLNRESEINPSAPVEFEPNQSPEITPSSPGYSSQPSEEKQDALPPSKIVVPKKQKFK